MTSRHALSLALLSALLVSDPATGAAPEETLWRNALELRVGGKGWADTEGPFDRFPARASTTVRPAVWDLSRHSAGLHIGFISDAPSISVRWALTSNRVAMNHMPATGVSGVDLYVRRDGRWHFLAIARPGEKGTANEQRLVQGLESREAEYRLYLPLYNGVERVEVGVPAGSSVRPSDEPNPPPSRSSSTDVDHLGGAAPRGPGWPTRRSGRKLGLPVVNLGFSGNGKGPEIARLMAELDPAAFVLDCLPNTTTEQVGARLPGFIEVLRGRHPLTPIVLVENVVYTDAAFVATRGRKVQGANELLARIHRERVDKGDRRIVLVPARDLIGSDGEGTVDGTHPTDLGFVRMADAIEPFLRQALSDLP
ncbi:MAG: SGNH/GDSL hydrolase family protein [Singulisphaera sp.]